MPCFHSPPYLFASLIDDWWECVRGAAADDSRGVWVSAADGWAHHYQAAHENETGDIPKRSPVCDLVVFGNRWVCQGDISIATALTSLLVCILSFISYAGKKFNSLSAQYRLGASTISQIVMETCGALYQLMKKDFLKVSSGYNHLLKYNAHLLLGTFQWNEFHHKQLLQ